FGNRQLLSIFFVVVFLLGIFFVMGYIVGRNSTPGPTIASNKPAALDTGETLASRQAAQAPSGSGATATPVDSSPPQTAAAAPPETKPAASRIAETARAVAKTRPERKADSSPVETASTQPPAGEEFLQVVAVAHPDAEVIIDTLQRRGFPARIAPGPSDKIFRVLVGPVKDAADIGKLRSQLEAAGFKPIVRKY
ncbi:MAG: SPOR domain-containing protein, partial [Bryobacteraceae bacterium]